MDKVLRTITITVLVPLAGLFSNHRVLEKLATRPRAEPVEEPQRTARRRQPLSPEQIDELVDAFTSGSTVKELAARFEIHRTTVMDYLRRRRVPRRGEWSDQMVATAAQRYAGGETLDQVAAGLSVDPRTVGRQLRAAGIEIRPSGPRRRR